MAVDTSKVGTPSFFNDVIRDAVTSRAESAAKQAAADMQESQSMIKRATLNIMLIGLGAGLILIGAYALAK